MAIEIYSFLALKTDVSQAPETSIEFERRSPGADLNPCRVPLLQSYKRVLWFELWREFTQAEMNKSLLISGSVTTLFIVHRLRTLHLTMLAVVRVGAPISLLLWCSCALGLNPNQSIDQLYHSSWTAKQGISGNVTALAQTTDGYLWVGTSDRLLRFNGISFEAYRPEVGSLGAASVSALLATPDGGLWIGYTRGGASFLKNG